MDLTFIDRALGSDIPYVTYAVPVFFLLIGVELAVALWQRRASLSAARFDKRPELRHHRAGRGPVLEGAAFSGLPGDVMLTRPARGSTWSTSRATPPAASGWRRSCCSWVSIARTTGSIASPTNTTPPGPGTSCTIRVKITTWRWRCGRGRFRGSSRGSSTCRWHWSGFPPAWFAAVSSFDTLYQFWIHTRLIGKLGPLEWVLNTPSHHRVHHARNPKYLDKNYAGHADHLGPDVRYVSGGGGRAGLWAGQALEQLEPALGQPARLERTVPRRLAGAAVERQAPDLVHAAGLEARGLAPQSPVLPRSPARPSSPTTRRYRAGLNAYALAQFVAALLLAFGLMATGKSLARGDADRRGGSRVVGVAQYRRHLRTSPLGTHLRALAAPGDGRALGRQAARWLMACARAGGPRRWPSWRCGFSCSAIAASSTLRRDFRAVSSLTERLTLNRRRAGHRSRQPSLSRLVWTAVRHDRDPRRRQCQLLPFADRVVCEARHRGAKTAFPPDSTAIETVAARADTGRSSRPARYDHRSRYATREEPSFL